MALPFEFFATSVMEEKKDQDDDGNGHSQQPKKNPATHVCPSDSSLKSNRIQTTQGALRFPNILRRGTNIWRGGS
jgi:hypothetical protein